MRHAVNAHADVDVKNGVGCKTTQSLHVRSHNWVSVISLMAQLWFQEHIKDHTRLQCATARFIPLAHEVCWLVVDSLRWIRPTSKRFKCFKAHSWSVYFACRADSVLRRGQRSEAKPGKACNSCERALHLPFPHTSAANETAIYNSWITRERGRKGWRGGGIKEKAGQRMK